MTLPARTRTRQHHLTPRGLPIAKKKDRRLTLIVEALLCEREEEEGGALDVICRQELWRRKDYERIKKALEGRYPHAFYFKSGIVGSGLATFSRFPIVETFFKRFTLCGSPDRFWHGDWYSGKGIGGIRLALPLSPAAFVDVYNVHTHAEYNKERTWYAAHRLAQLVEIYRFVNQTTRTTAEGATRQAAIVCGDFNTLEDDFAYEMVIKSHCVLASYPMIDLVDAYKALHGDTTDGDGGVTFRAPGNTFAKAGRAAQRIDYILYGARPGFACTHIAKAAASSPPPAAEGGATAISLSDHEMVCAHFAIDPATFLAGGAPKDGQPAAGCARGSRVSLEEEQRFYSEALVLFLHKKRRIIRWQVTHDIIAAVMVAIFIGLTITTAVTIPNDQLTTLLILAFFAVQPITLVTAAISLGMAHIFLREERVAVSAFIDELRFWFVRNQLPAPPAAEAAPDRCESV